MEEMGITDTPYIIVRHTDKPHPHCHIMFSRVDYDGKIITSATNRYRNKAVCLDLTRHHNLTMGTDSLSLDPEKLRGSERSKVEIRQIANEVLSNSAVLNVAAFIARMKDRGVKVEVLRDKTPEQKMKTLIYWKGNHSFVASKIDKRFTPNNVVKELNRHAEHAEQVRMSSTVTPKISGYILTVHRSHLLCLETSKLYLNSSNYMSRVIPSTSEMLISDSIPKPNSPMCRATTLT